MCVYNVCVFVHMTVDTMMVTMDITMDVTMDIIINRTMNIIRTTLDIT